MARAKKAEKPAVENNKKIVDKYFDVIIKPLVTEKTMKLTQQENKITVVVAKNASKNESFLTFLGMQPDACMLASW